MYLRIFLTSLFALFLIATATLAQSGSDVVVSDQVMKQVVGRIARYMFKPSRAERTIPVAAANTKIEWFPEIPNVKFKLVPEEEITNYEKGVFQIGKPERDGNAFTINIGWGDMECDAQGQTWKFVVTADRIRIWPTGLGWGRSCGGNMPPTIRGLKIGEVSPNELMGYRFFANGKLKGLRLGYSMRDDVKQIFGSDCSNKCDYDEKWFIDIGYFDDQVAFCQETDDKNVDLQFMAKPNLVGTISSIKFTPKSKILFTKIRFSPSFRSGSRYSIGDCFDLNGFCGAVHTSTDVYEDGYGLSYSIYDEETFNNLRADERKNEEKPKKGELLSIEYKIPDVLNDLVYEKRKAQRIEGLPRCYYP